MESEDQPRPPDEDLIEEEEVEAASDAAPDDDVVREEEAAAAAQASQIGGSGGADDVEDEAQRPLAEAGEGESEGFEQAEKQLIENSGDMGAPDPTELAGEPEQDRTDAVYGEPDEVESTEVEDDTTGPERS